MFPAESWAKPAQEDFQSMNSRQRLLAAFGDGIPDRTPVCLFISDSDLEALQLLDIELPPAEALFAESTETLVEALIAFHEMLGLDIMLRIGANVYEPIGVDGESEDWRHCWGNRFRFRSGYLGTT